MANIPPPPLGFQIVGQGASIPPPAGFTIVPTAIDRHRGAPASVRQAVGSARLPQDRLATLRKFYPDAQPHEDDNFIFTDPETGRSTLYNPPGFDAGDVASVSGEAAEMAGGVIGGALAVPAAVAGAVPTAGASLLSVPAGVGLGAAGARELHDLAAAQLGGTVDTRGVPARAADAAVTAGVNAVGHRVGELVERGVRAAVAPVRRAFPGLTSGQQALDDAALLGTEQTAGMVTGNRALQSMENAMANTPGGAGVMQAAAERAMSDLDAAAGRIAQGFRGHGQVQSAQGAGQRLREGARAAGERFATRREQLDDALMTEIGANQVVPVRNVGALEAELTRYLNQAFNSRNPEFRGALEELRSVLADAGMLQATPNGNVVQLGAANGGLPFEVLRSIRTRIGRDLERPDISGYTPSTEAAMRRVYGALSEDIRAAAHARGPRAQQLLAAHDRYVRFNRNVNLPALQRIEDAGTDEQAFNLAMTAARDGGTTLTRLRRSLRPEEWDVVASSVLAKMGRATPGQQTASTVGEAADDFSASTFLTNWSKLAPEAKQALFGGNRYRDLMPELDALVRQSARVRDAAKMANPSGTARNTIAALTVLGAGGQLLGGDVQGAGVTVGGAILAPRAVARLLTSPGFVRWLGDTTVAVANRPAAWGPRLGQLVAVAKAEPEIREEVYQYLDALRSVDSGSQLQ